MVSYDTHECLSDGMVMVQAAATGCTAAVSGEECLVSSNIRARSEVEGSARGSRV